MPHNCIVSGWGATETNPYPKFQRWAQVEIWKKNECRQYVSSNRISKVMCAGNSENFEARICNGDSGGPLACVQDKAMILVGITSHSFDCKETYLNNRRPPSFFTRVTQYVDWINQYTVIAKFQLMF